MYGMLSVSILVLYRLDEEISIHSKGQAYHR